MATLCSLWDAVKLTDFDGKCGQIGVTTAGVVQAESTTTAWFTPQPEVHNEQSGQLLENVSGDLMGMMHQGRISFRQPHSNSVFYSFDIKPEHLIQMKSIATWSFESPSEYAQVLIHTKDQIHCYTYEDGGLKIATAGTNLPQLNHVRFVDQSSFYAWNETHLYRLSIDNDQIFVSRRLLNNYGASIINICATPRFLLVHCNTGVYTVCQSTGVQIARVSNDAFTKIHLVTDELNTMFGVTASQIKVIELNKRGFIVADIYSLPITTLAKVVHGASALYVADQTGHHWLTKWSPEKKLARLVNSGDLETARLFAEHHGLCDESIAQSELTCLVASGGNLTRVTELLEQIEDQNFLCDFALKLSGVTDAEKIVLEHLETIKIEDFMFEMYHNQDTVQSTTHWKDMIISGLKQGQYQLCKAEIISHISDMDEQFLMSVVQSIPESITCHDLCSFFDQLLAVLLSRFPNKVRQLMPQWLVGRITAFESDSTAWPSKCLELINMVYETTVSDTGGAVNFTRVGHCGTGVKVLQSMKNQLTTLVELKENYDVTVSFKDFNNLLLNPIWQLELISMKISSAKQSEIEPLLTKFVTPFLSANCRNGDDIFVEELAKAKWNTDVKIRFIESISDAERRKKALYNLLLTFGKPWPKQVENFALNIFKSA